MNSALQTGLFQLDGKQTLFAKKKEFLRSLSHQKQIHIVFCNPLVIDINIHIQYCGIQIELYMFMDISRFKGQFTHHINSFIFVFTMVPSMSQALLAMLCTYIYGRLDYS